MARFRKTNVEASVSANIRQFCGAFPGTRHGKNQTVILHFYNQFLSVLLSNWFQFSYNFTSNNTDYCRCQSVIRIWENKKLKAPNFYLFDTQLSKQFNNNVHSKFIIYEKR